MNDLRREIEKTMNDAEWLRQFEADGGPTAGDVLNETKRRTGGFELCSVLDAHDELSALYR